MSYLYLYLNINIFEMRRLINNVRKEEGEPPTILPRIIIMIMDLEQKMALNIGEGWK